jgi:ABC-type uncharacterized transport system permease subunit
VVKAEVTAAVKVQRARLGSLRRALRGLADSALASLIGLLFGAVLMWAFGYDAFGAYAALFRGAFMDPEGLMESMAVAVPLILTALTFAIGVRAGLFNIGAEGQMYLGAIGAIIVGSFMTVPAPFHLLAATASGMLFGMLWSLPVVALKLARQVHEVFSTIMMNWVAYWLTIYLITYFLADPFRAERALPVKETARYQVIGATLTTVVFPALILAVATYLILWRTTVGFEIRVTGSNIEASRYAGIRQYRVYLASIALGGLAAGLAGASQVLGRPPSWTVYATLGNVMNIGYEGLGVALIGRNHPIGIIFAALFYGGLIHGGRFMEFYYGVASEIVRAINGIIIIALAVPELATLLKSVVRRGQGT